MPGSDRADKRCTWHGVESRTDAVRKLTVSTAAGTSNTSTRGGKQCKTIDYS